MSDEDLHPTRQRLLAELATEGAALRRVERDYERTKRAAVYRQQALCRNARDAGLSVAEIGEALGLPNRAAVYRLMEQEYA